MTFRIIAFAGLLAGLAVQEPAQAAPPDFGPDDISYIASATGYEPLSRPVRSGSNFVLRAVDPYDVAVRLVIDARTGRVVSSRPVGTPVAAPLYGQPAYAPGPYGYYEPAYAPPGYDEPMGPASVRPRTATPRTPLPRPRPETLAKATPAPAAATPAQPETKPETPAASTTAVAPQTPPETAAPALAPEAKPDSPADAKPN